MVDVGLIVALYGSIVAIMNPFTALNNYVTLTEGLPREEADRVLKTALAIVVALGVLFILAGRLILEFYHISLNALRFGGGILLMYIAVDMLSGQPKAKRVDPGEVAVVPLATPMIVGPGTMTLLIHLGTTMPLPETMVAFAAATATVAVALKGARLAVRLLGRNGVKAMARFMALIIASVASQMIWASIKSWAREILEGTPAETILG